MTVIKDKVKGLCDEVYKKNYQQITIDLVQEEIEPLLIDETITRDSVGSAAYLCGILLEVFNPKFEIDVSLLTILEKALSEWANDIEWTNQILGIPKEK